MKGKIIGNGATAEVFEYGNNKALKLYHIGTKEENVIWEFNKMQQAYSQRIPCPKPFEIIHIEGRIGYLMERFHGVTLKEKLVSDIQNVITNKISIEDFSGLFFEDVKGIARALSNIHSLKVSEWETLNEKFKIETETTTFLSQEEKNKILIILEILPHENTVCHGDPNPNNIMICNGEYRFIDWVNAGIGNPLFDIAEYIWLNTPRENVDFTGVPKALVEFYIQYNSLIVPTFMSEYKKVSGREIANYDRYMVPLLVRKLHSNRSEEEKNSIVLEIRKIIW